QITAPPDRLRHPKSRIALRAPSPPRSRQSLIRHTDRRRTTFQEAAHSKTAMEIYFEFKIQNNNISVYIISYNYKIQSNIGFTIY
ncbi:hypothetical protein, partial [Methylobacterium sp. BTF04]|uniref:hypothetical protein n=1 Tax=Methylobacterium sp. BTF04 TaxID=2708300 RepID=UPI001952B7B0